VFDASLSAANRAEFGPRPVNNRSKISNGSRMLAGVDGRSAEARRFRDLKISFADDCGGAAAFTESQRALVAQAATLTIQAERLQASMLQGEAVDVEQQTRVANSLARTLARLGIRKRVGTKLSVPEYLAARDARRAQGQ
jgi:hypothetical protein